MGYRKGKASEKYTFTRHLPTNIVLGISFFAMSKIPSSALVTFSPDGTTLTFAFGNKIILLNVKTDNIRSIFTGDDIKSFIFSPDGTMLASVSHTTRLWNVATGEKILTIITAENEDPMAKMWKIRYYVLSVAFSQDSNMLASGSYSGTIRLYDAATDEKIRTLTGHKKDPVNSVTFNQTGTILASVSTDGTIRLWHLIDLEEIKKLSTLELLLIYALQHAVIINLPMYPELNTIYNQTSDLVKKLIKTLTPQPEKRWWQYWY